VATLISSIITQTRAQLLEPTARYWTDDQLLAYINNGIKDLWRRINDLYMDYFVTVDITNVTLAANSSTLSGVPADVFRIVSIEPRVLGESNPNKGVIFKPRAYQDPDMAAARAAGARAPNNTIIFYTVQNAGGPVGAPTIRIAPQITSAMDLTLVYNQVLAAVTAGSNNPIPGESDNALIAWTVAYALSRQRDDGAPDPEWLAIYGTEKTNLVQQLTPRQIQEPSVADSFLMGDGFSDWD
jgi:hypothetical protein